MSKKFQRKIENFVCENCKEKININKQKPHRIYEESAKWIKFKTGNIPAIKTVARSKIKVINTIFFSLKIFVKTGNLPRS